MGTCGTWLFRGQNGDDMDHPPPTLGCPPRFGSYFFSCRPSPKPSLLDGWKTSMDGSAGREGGEALGATAAPVPRAQGNTASRPSPLTRAIEVLGEGEAQAEDDGLRPQHLPCRRHLLLPRESHDWAQPQRPPAREGNLGTPRRHVPILHVPGTPRGLTSRKLMFTWRSMSTSSMVPYSL